MVGIIFILVFLAAVRTSLAKDAQVPLTSFLRSDSIQSDTYKFEWPIHKIAIIGAGPGGLMAYREFFQAGYDVHVFERDDSPGGNWHYTDETPLSCPVPNADIAVADFTPSLPPKGAKLPYIEEYQGGQIGEEIRRDHRKPKAIWASLKSNAPAAIMQITEFPWPQGTPWELPQQTVQKYLRAFASWHGINTNDGNSHIHYNTRVESVQKRYAEDGSRIGWTVTAKELVKTLSNTTRATWTAQDFDAVVVATGGFNAPNMPNIEGLAEWAKRFPDRISHSRQYRRPEPFSNQTVLIVGAAISGVEISRDIIRHVRKVYQSIRPDRLGSTLPQSELDAIRNRLPPNITLVPEIKRFLPVGSQFNEGKVELVNGTIISGLDHIIFATGFRFSFPFLSEYHNSSIGLNDTVPRGSPQPIITDGSHVRSLYMDTFYIDDPTLAFSVNFIPYSFTFPEYLFLAMAKVWAGKADLPCTAELWRRYDKVVEDRGGYGKDFQVLDFEGTKAAIRFFRGWLNADAVKYGGKQIDGIPDTHEIEELWFKVYFPAPDSTPAASRDGPEPWAQDFAFSHNW